MSDSLDYGKLMHKALRRFMADVLAQVAEKGLPGDHHFFITFDTTHPGVSMAGSLMDRYPEEMTVVIQEWYDDLAVLGDRFTVTLNFGNVPEPIVIPFEAIKTFVDPSVEFGLRFDAHEPETELPTAEEPVETEAPGATPDREGEVVSLDTFRKH